MKAAIRQHLAGLSPEAIRDIYVGNLDEVITDALYAAAGASTFEEMTAAREIARELARPFSEEADRELV